MIGGGVLAFTFALTAVAAQTTPPNATSETTSDRRVTRAYEIDLGTPTALPEAELATLLHENEFDAIVFWLAPDDPASGGLPQEPLARRLDPIPPSLVGPAKPFIDQGLAIAAGIRRAGVLEPGHAPLPDRAIRVESGDHDDHPDLLARLVRPGVRSFPFLGALRNSTGSLSSRLLLPTNANVKAIQAKLDVIAFSVEDPRFESFGKVYGSQSAIVAERMAKDASGPSLELYLPIENEWLAPPLPSPRPLLRRGDPQLDLEELLFTPSSLLDRALRGPFVSDAPRIARLPAVLREHSKGDLPSDDGEPLPFFRQARLFCDLFDDHEQAAAEFARYLATAAESKREEAAAALARLEGRLAKVEPNADGWRKTVAIDRALLESALPWRIRRTSWTITSPKLRDGLASAERVVAEVDDPRLAGWKDVVGDALGSPRIDLWQWLDATAATPVTLATEIALPQPRTFRLSLDAAASRAIRVNGTEVITAFAAERGPLVTTLSLPAGKNRIEVALRLDERVSGASNAKEPAGTITLHLTPLPSRVEGIVLDPARASRITEPLLKLRDPNAFGEESLVWPDGRRSPSDGSAKPAADFPFPTSIAASLDVWIHALPRADREGTVIVALDGRSPQEVPVAAGGRWSWLRAPAPIRPGAGDHTLHVDFPTAELRVDQLVLLPSDAAFPRWPDGKEPLAATAWKFDPLGAGTVLELPRTSALELFDRNFTLERDGPFDLYVWLKGGDPIEPGDHAELELTSPSFHGRFVLPGGTPLEEWVVLGSVALRAGERIDCVARGAGALARLALVR